MNKIMLLLLITIVSVIGMKPITAMGVKDVKLQTGSLWKQWQYMFINPLLKANTPYLKEEVINKAIHYYSFDLNDLNQRLSDPFNAIKILGYEDTPNVQFKPEDIENRYNLLTNALHIPSLNGKEKVFSDQCISLVKNAYEYLTKKSI